MLCEEGGLEIATPERDDYTLLAHAAVVVRMEVLDDIPASTNDGSTAR